MQVIQPASGRALARHRAFRLLTWYFFSSAFLRLCTSRHPKNLIYVSSIFPAYADGITHIQTFALSIFRFFPWAFQAATLAGCFFRKSHTYTQCLFNKQHFYYKIMNLYKCSLCGLTKQCIECQLLSHATMRLDLSSPCSGGPPCLEMIMSPVFLIFSHICISKGALGGFGV